MCAIESFTEMPKLVAIIRLAEDEAAIFNDWFQTLRSSLNVEPVHFRGPTLPQWVPTFAIFWSSLAHRCWTLLSMASGLAMCLCKRRRLHCLSLYKYDITSSHYVRVFGLLKKN
uniref:Uncharacterized protein n=1 Tax=Kalanchoe fedtschenkoi TaxID=63787 RepID=A0A7N0RCP2_KALFE